MLFELVKKIFNKGVSSSRAKSRLQFVLVQDRTGLTSDDMSKFKEELIAVIEKYFVVDKTGLEIDYKRETESTCLFINSPVVVRRQDSKDGQVGSKRQKSENKKTETQAAPAV